MMGRGFLLVTALGLPVAALAQGMSPITATPLLPPAGTAPQTVPNVAAVPQPAEQTQQPAAQQPAQPGATTAIPSGPQQMQLTWVPQGEAQVQVLDKVNAQNTVLTLKVGQQAQYESLTIQVTACSIHPPDQPRDAAAYLKITDNHPDSPGFQGWMLADNPALSMLESPMYDVRVVGCQA